MLKNESREPLARKRKGDCLGMIQNFEFFNKTNLIFGKGTENEAGKHVRKYADSVLICHDGGAYLEPLLARVKQSMDAAGVKVYELPGVQPNPHLSLVRKGIEMCQKENIGFVLGIGGGSVMDTAKFVALGVHDPGDVWTYQSFTPITSPIVPSGCISTLPGTGSEFSAVAMIVNDEGEYPVKALFGSPQIKFDFAIMNPELYYTLPKKQAAAGAVDIIAHLTENYFGSTTDADQYEGYIEAGVKSVMRNIKLVLKDPTNYEAQSNLALSSIMPFSYLTSGVQADMCVHNIEKPLTSTYNQTHGVMLGILTPAWMKYCYKRDIPKHLRFAVNCMGAQMNYLHPEETIEQGIENFENFVKSLGLPTRLSELGIDDSKFGFCADMGLFNDRNNRIGFVSKLSYEEVIEVYKLAL